MKKKFSFIIISIISVLTIGISAHYLKTGYEGTLKNISTRNLTSSLLADENIIISKNSINKLLTEDSFYALSPLYSFSKFSLDITSTGRITLTGVDSSAKVTYSNAIILFIGKLLIHITALLLNLFVLVFADIKLQSNIFIKSKPRKSDSPKVIPFPGAFYPQVLKKTV